MSKSKTKKCTKCGKVKLLCEFHKHKNHSKDGLHSWCKSCKSILRNKNYYQSNKIKLALKRKQYYKTHKQEAKNNYLLLKYNISLKQYNDMFNKQQGCCIVCGRHQSECVHTLVVDHCHLTGKIRGLLCNRCNLVIGFIKDNSKLAIAIANYLKCFEA